MSKIVRYVYAVSAKTHITTAQQLTRQHIQLHGCTNSY